MESTVAQEAATPANQDPSGPLEADLVFEGGGVKGIGLAGAFLSSREHGYKPQCVAGTAAGAIMASLVARVTQGAS